MLKENPEVNVIALIRGGGRYENLAVFDDIDVVRAICHSPKVIVTGIGHQRDSSLVDDVADHAAVTPTAAATYLAELCLRPQSVASSTVTANPMQTSINLSRGYKLLLIVLLLLAVGALAFLGFAILHTALALTTIVAAERRPALIASGCHSPGY